MLYAAGAGHCLVGTIAHSKEPAEAASVPVVGDAETLDFEQLLALRPTVVVVAVDVVQRVRIDRIRALGIPGLPGARHAASRRCPNRCAGWVRSPAPQAIARPRADDARPPSSTRIGARYRDRAPLRVLYQIWDRPIYTIGGRHVITDALRAVRRHQRVRRPRRPRRPRSRARPRCCAIRELILVSAPPASADEWLAEWRRVSERDRGAQRPAAWPTPTNAWIAWGRR